MPKQIVLIDTDTGETGGAFLAWLDARYARATAPPAAPVITTTTLGALVQGEPKSVTLTYSGGQPASWSVSAGSLPAGLVLNTSTGVISGTPTGTGSYSFTITATNAGGSDGQAFSGTITNAYTPNPPIITTTSLGTLTQGQFKSVVLAYSGGQPNSWTLSGGSLPAGMTLSGPPGTIAGTPTGSGAYSFEITATNNDGSDTQAFSGTIGTAGAQLTVLRSDTFDRADTATAGTSTSDAGLGGTPAAWQENAAAWSILNNRLRKDGGAAGGQFLPVDRADYEARAQVGIMTSATGTTLYCIDGRRSQIATSGSTQYRLYFTADGAARLLVGSSTVLATAPAGTFAVGDWAGLRMKGSAISIVKATTATGAGTVVATVNDTTLNPATSFTGFSGAHSIDGAWDAFLVLAA